MADVKEIEFLGDFINGEFRPVGNTYEDEWSYPSPADLNDTVLTPKVINDHVDYACEAAKKTFLDWAHTPFEKRKEYLMRIKEIYLSYADELAETISRETGKPLWEAKTEAKAMAGKIDITVNYSMNMVKDQVVENALPDINGVTRYKPRGVMAVIGPFNFPGHLPNGHIIPALATGNTVVFKPSDRTPAVGQLMAKIFSEAELPPGVFNMIQGRGEIGKRLAGHENVDGVLFTGSYDVGLKIKQETLHHYWKLLALEMGGKNCAVVWEDADLKKAVYECLVGAFLTSGQRCSCTSKILLHESVFDQFVESFYESAKKIKIGHWSENPFMGPIINEDAVEKFVRFQEIAKRENAKSLMRGKQLSLDHKGYYVTPSINIVEKYDEKSVYLNNEIFGPNVAIVKIKDFDEAVKINNDSGFGLVMSLFTKNKDLYQKALLDARVGLLNLNRTTNGASSKLPFGGMGKSGNDRPSAHFAVNYCTVPVASLEDETDFDETKIMPGIDFIFK